MSEELSTSQKSTHLMGANETIKEKGRMNNYMKGAKNGYDLFPGVTSLS